MTDKIEEVFRSLGEDKMKIIGETPFLIERGAAKNRLADELLKVLFCGHALLLVDVKANKDSVDEVIAEMSKAKYKVTVKYCLINGLSSEIVICDEESSEVKNILDELPEDIRMAVILGGGDLLGYAQYRFGGRGVKIAFIMNEPTGDPFDPTKNIIDNKRLQSFAAKAPDITIIDTDILNRGKNALMHALALATTGGYYLIEGYYQRAKRHSFSLRLLTALEEEYIVTMKSLSGSTGRAAIEKLLRLIVVFSLARRATDTSELDVGNRLLYTIAAQCEELETETFAALICVVLKNYYLRLNKICGLFFPQNRQVSQKILQKNLEIEGSDLLCSNKSDFAYENYVMVDESKEILRRIVALDKINPLENLKRFSADKGFLMKKICAVKYIEHIKAAIETVSDGTLLKNLYVKGLI